LRAEIQAGQVIRRRKIRAPSPVYYEVDAKPGIEHRAAQRTPRVLM
jgi:hypothetical protein